MKVSFDKWNKNHNICELNERNIINNLILEIKEQFQSILPEADQEIAQQETPYFAELHKFNNALENIINSSQQIVKLLIDELEHTKSMLNKFPRSEFFKTSFSEFDTRVKDKNKNISILNQAYLSSDCVLKEKYLDLVLNLALTETIQLCAKQTKICKRARFNFLYPPRMPRDPLLIKMCGVCCRLNCSPSRQKQYCGFDINSADGMMIFLNYIKRDEYLKNAVSKNKIKTIKEILSVLDVRKRPSGTKNLIKASVSLHQMIKQTLSKATSDSVIVPKIQGPYEIFFSKPSEIDAFHYIQYIEEHIDNYNVGKNLHFEVVNKQPSESDRIAHYPGPMRNPNWLKSDEEKRSETSTKNVMVKEKFKSDNANLVRNAKKNRKAKKHQHVKKEKKRIVSEPAFTKPNKEEQYRVRNKKKNNRKKQLNIENQKKHKKTTNRKVRIAALKKSTELKKSEREIKSIEKARKRREKIQERFIHHESNVRDNGIDSSASEEEHLEEFLDFGVLQDFDDLVKNNQTYNKIMANIPGTRWRKVKSLFEHLGVVIGKKGATHNYDENVITKGRGKIKGSRGSHVWLNFHCKPLQEIHIPHTGGSKEFGKGQTPDLKNTLEMLEMIYADSKRRYNLEGRNS